MTHKSSLDSAPGARFVVTSIYGDSEQDAGRADALGRALAQHGILLLAARTDGRPSWAGDGALMASHVRNVWLASDVPVVWLDIDTDIASFPDWTTPLNADFAVHDQSREGGRPSDAGSDFACAAIWFGKSAITGELLTQWEQHCRAGNAIAANVHLARAWFDVASRQPLKTLWLPAAYSRPATAAAERIGKHPPATNIRTATTAQAQAPVVSILIPAFKPQYLRQSIISAQNQTFGDIEILVGDDTRDGRLEGIVRELADGRTHYLHHGMGDGELNLRQLWARARGRYIKILFDDDILFPTSVEVLLTALQSHPESSLAFHERVFIDENGTVTQTPPALLPPGKTALVNHDTIVGHMVAGIHNFIGEPSNLMLNRDLVDISTAFQYRSLKLDSLGDVALYVNLSKAAPLVAVGGYLSAFRRHSLQISSDNSPSRSAGLYEFELFLRGEASEGFLSRETLDTARRNLRALYAGYTTRYPELIALNANLEELTRRSPRELFNSKRFQNDLQSARTAVASRVALGRRKQENFCSVCQKPVPAWLPHPSAASVDMRVMLDLEVVGSRLDKYLCPNCRCNDRDRHLWLYMSAAGLLDDVAGMRILHVAPEMMLEPKLRMLQPREYVAGDLHPRDPQHQRVNVETLDFPDGYFDLIICNHVLEHVDHPHRALSEFSRCLAPGGRLVAQTPYSPILVQTMELSKTASAGFRTLYYGQDDHVRLFGADITDRFRAAGLDGDLYLHTTVLGDIDPEASGCNPLEPFFLFAKGKTPAFPRTAPLAPPTN